MKKYIKDMNSDELELVYNNNDKLQKELFERVYEDNMDAQLYEYEYLIPKEAHDYYRYHDYYNSFFFTLNEYEGYNFLHCLDFKILKEYDVATSDDEKLFKKLENYFNHCNYNSDAFYTNLEKLDVLATKILKNIEELLKQYENVDDSDILTFWLDEYGHECYNDCYIIDDSYKLFEEISYTKEY